MRSHVAAAVPALLTLLAPAAAQADRTDDYVQRVMKRQNIPGLSLAVIRNGEVVKAKGYGLANVELGVRATPSTVFQLQSVTKSFTAAAVMMLMEEGKLGLDDPVSQHLEGTPESWKAVMIRHLLTHTSGIKDFINEPTASLRLDVSEEDVLKATAPRPLNFPPGERWSYSNTNYHLLAMILRKLTGKGWGELLRERVFEPQGMGATRVVSLYDTVPNRAAGYLWENGALHNGHYVAASILGYAGGGICSTVLDLAKWDGALAGEKLLKKASLAQMWSPVKLNDGKTYPYGFGWGLGEANGHRYVGHGGGHMTGFSTYVVRYPDDGLMVVVLANRAGADAGAIALRVAAMHDRRLATPPAKPIEDKEPQVTAFLEGVLRKTAEGTLDPESLTPEMKAAVVPGPLREAAELLRSLGPRKPLALLERREQGALRVYRYRAAARKGTLVFTCALTKDDKIAGMFVNEE